jgi:hypothetical protein
MTTKAEGKKIEGNGVVSGDLDELVPETSDLDTLVRAAVAEINKGSITLVDLLKTLAPTPTSEVMSATLPVPAEITQEQRDALEKVVEVFGKVVPTERRALVPTEISDLVEEKETLDQLKGMVASRHENIRTTIFNHFDVEAEERGIPDGTVITKDSHYALPGEARGLPDTPQKFTRQISNVSPSLNLDVLRTLEEDPDVEFSHKDYLAITDQVRVLNEHKLMLALKKNPKLIVAIARAIKKGSKTASMYLRKA